MARRLANAARGDRLLKDRIADFDGDGYADVIITSAWGIGVLGTNASGWTSKTVVQWGTDIGGWVLAPDDYVAAVGVFANASPAGAAMIILQHKDKGLAFVKVTSAGALQAASVIANSAIINGGGSGWRVRYGDRLFNVGKTRGSVDAIAIMSDWGFGVFEPSYTGPHPDRHRPGRDRLQRRRLQLHPPGARSPRAGLRGRHGQPRRRPRRAGPHGRQRSGGDGHKTSPTSNVGAAPWDLLFKLDDGKVFAGTSVKGTLHSVIKPANFDNTNGADLMFQTETGIAIMGKTPGSSARRGRPAESPATPTTRGSAGAGTSRATTRSRLTSPGTSPVIRSPSSCSRAAGAWGSARARAPTSPPPPSPSDRCRSRIPASWWAWAGSTARTRSRCSTRTSRR